MCGHLYSVVSLRSSPLSTKNYYFIGYKEWRVACKCPGLQLEWKNEMNLKFISLHEQHLFQVRSPLEGVQLFGEGHVGAGLRELRKSIQESGILEKVFFGLLYIMLQLLEKTQ